MSEKILTAAELLKEPLGDLYEQAKNQVKAKLAPMRTAKAINGLYRKLNNVQKVKTIWQVDREVNLRKFYYPSQLLVGAECLKVSRVNEIPYDGNIVITGTQGQGKSIFLRYLCGQELLGGKRIPIFLELRKLRRNEPLAFHIKNCLENLGFDTSEITTNYIFTSGLAILMLDGFDEIDPELVQEVISDLEKISERWAKTQILITSRADSDIEKSQFFRVFKLAFLTPNDHPHILTKLVENENDRKDILKNLSRNPSGIVSVLTTPLMMTLLVMHFRTEKVIPDHFSEFYENLFQTLLVRHDRTKPGFRRKRRTALGERVMQDVFEAFSYYSIIKGGTSFKYDEAINLATKSADAIGCTVDSDAYINDVCKVTCLLIEESNHYSFIHKSVQEYHAAAFVRSRPEVSATKFYSSIRNGQWHHWKEVLGFLDKIDAYRFNKLYLVPSIEAMLDDFGIRSREEWMSPNRELIISKIKDIKLSVDLRGTVTLTNIDWRKNQQHNRFISYLLTLASRKIFAPNFSEGTAKFISEAKSREIITETVNDIEVFLDKAFDALYEDEDWILKIENYLKGLWGTRRSVLADISKRESVIDPL